MNNEEFMTTCWHYYLTLERRLIETFDYVNLSEKNKGTFSNEFQSLLLDIGSEFEIQMKNLLNMNNTESDIKEWQKKVVNGNIMDKDNKLSVIYPSDINEIDPIKDWNVNVSAKMAWWKNYNSVKHNRLDKYEEGSLDNVLSAFSALYLVLRYVYFTIDNSGTIIQPASKVFLTTWGNDHLAFANVQSFVTYTNN